MKKLIIKIANIIILIIAIIYFELSGFFRKGDESE